MGERGAGAGPNGDRVRGEGGGGRVRVWGGAGDRSDLCDDQVPASRFRGVTLAGGAWARQAMKSSACARRVVAATAARSPRSESVPGERAARVSRNAVAYATRTDEVNKDRALRNLVIRGAVRAVRMALSWGWAAAHA